MQPFDALGLPSPDECRGMGGLIVSLIGGLVGAVWLLAFAGGPPSFMLIVLSVVLGGLSFMYCVVWDGSWPVTMGSSDE